MTVFFRILSAEDKATALANAIDLENAGQAANQVLYTIAPKDFRSIPGAPFAYWVPWSVRNLFNSLQPFDAEGRTVRVGLQTGDDFRFVRSWWEVAPRRILDGGKGPYNDTKRFQDWCQSRTQHGAKWVSFAKGGEYAQYYADVHLLVNWEDNGKEIKSLLGPDGRVASRPQNADYYFLPGLTWSDRTTRLFSSRIWPPGGIFSVKGSAGFSTDPGQLANLLGLMNSLLFNMFLSLLVGAGDTAARSYQVGTIGRVPVAPIHDDQEIGRWAFECWSTKREIDQTNEVSRVFLLPALLATKSDSLYDCLTAWSAHVSKADAQLSERVKEIDDAVFDIYGVSIRDRSLIEESLTRVSGQGPKDLDFSGDEEEDQENQESPTLPKALTASVLSYAVGCAFGRWDIRMALSPFTAPQLAGPFDPLPISPPGSLVGPDGLPATAGLIVSEEWLRKRADAITLPVDVPVEHLTIPDKDYPLEVAWDGILVDDEGHPRDMVGRMRAALDCLWHEQAGVVEHQACEMLDVLSLRQYVRNPRGFWEDHVKLYSKSRRKAPIYWLLQSRKRSYGLWLYYQRLDADLLFKALTHYVEPKLQLEDGRWQDLLARKTQVGTTGAAARQLDRDIERQEAFLAELQDFRDKLHRAASYGLRPDLDDGVVLNAAPLWELMPWKVAKDYWEELRQGKYDWSSIGKQLRAKGLVF